MISWKPRIVSSSFTYSPGVPVNCSATKFGCDRKRCTLRTGDDELVLVGELVDAENRDDVLQVLVALQDLLHARRRLVVLVRDDSRLKCARDGVERIDGR